MNPFRQLLQWLGNFPGGWPRVGMSLVSRISRTAVVWSWGFSILRFASFLILLPLLTRLPGADFGFYYLLLSIVAVTPLIDLGFAASVERSVGYATAGATKLNAQGLPDGKSSGTANVELLWKLIHTARIFYRGLTLLLVLVLGGVGSYIVSRSAPETSVPSLAWVAWGVALLNAAFEVYASWWNIVLRGMNQVVAGTRILCLGYGLKLFLSCLLLILGWGVLSVFAAGLVASAVIRFLSRKHVLRNLPPDTFAPPGRHELSEMLGILWPNSWRIGLQLITSYVMALGLMLICEKKFGLPGAGRYGFSLNIVVVIQAIASVWITVKWPVIHQLRSRNDINAIRRLLWGRIWLERLTFLFLAIAAIVLTPFLLKIGGIRKDVLPSPWFVVLIVNAFLETHMIIWGTLLTTENRVPTLWPITFTNVLTVGLVLLLLNYTSIGFGAFALAPLITGSLFNYWFWPGAGARSLHSAWFRFMFRPAHLRADSTRSNSVASIA